MLDAELVDLEDSLLNCKGPKGGPTATNGSMSSPNAKARSLTNLSSNTLPLSLPSSNLEHDENEPTSNGNDERAKSMEFLLDENNKSSSVVSLKLAFVVLHYTVVHLLL